MRVTKSIRAYIEKEVKARIEPKYAAEKAETERQYELYDQFRTGALAAAKIAFWNYLNEHFGDVSDFCIMEDDPDFHISTSCHRWPIYIKDENIISSVHRYRVRMSKEIQDTVEKIVVELELGGDKTRLMELLSQI